MHGTGALPREQEALEVGNRNRLNLGAQPMDRQPMYPRQQPSVAPFHLRDARMKSAAQNESLGFQGKQRSFNLGWRQLEKPGERIGSDRSDRFDPPANQFANGIWALPLAL